MQISSYAIQYLSPIFISIIFNIEQSYFQMDCVSEKELNSDSIKIVFTDKVFGMPSKGRKQDPNMFQLLSWGGDGFQKHSFKKDERFQQPSSAYLNIIAKNPWKSQTHENFLNYHEHSIDANTTLFQKIENYIDNRQPQSARVEKKCPHPPHASAQKGKEIQKQQQRKENKVTNKANTRAKSLKNTIHQAEIRKIAINDNTQEVIASHKYKKTPSPKQKMPNRYPTENQRLQNQQVTKDDQTKLINHFKQTTRWIPNSSFTTYFGKPPFQNYGRGNTRPIDGGLVYGTYLYSHNVHPHRGNNHPKNVQTYPVALIKAKSQGTLTPSHPRTKLDSSNQLISNHASNYQKSKMDIEMENFNGLDIKVPRLREMQKFGGKRKMRFD